MGSESPEIVMLYCTCPDQAEAERIGNAIVEQGLAGCVNCVPGLTSIYKWDGEMKSGTEVLLLIKTAAARVNELTERLVELHPYELPEVIALPITTGLNEYLAWIDACTQN